MVSVHFSGEKRLCGVKFESVKLNVVISWNILFTTFLNITNKSLEPVYTADITK